MFDGTPDETLDEDSQIWAMNKLQAFVYRTHFHLTESEMAQETLESIAVNTRLMKLTAKKSEIDARAASSVR